MLPASDLPAPLVSPESAGRNGWAPCWGLLPVLLLALVLLPAAAPAQTVHEDDDVYACLLDFYRDYLEVHRQGLGLVANYYKFLAGEEPARYDPVLVELAAEVAEVEGVLDELDHVCEKEMWRTMPGVDREYLDLLGEHLGEILEGLNPLSHYLGGGLLLPKGLESWRSVLGIFDELKDKLDGFYSGHSRSSARRIFEILEDEIFPTMLELAGVARELMSRFLESQ